MADSKLHVAVVGGGIGGLFAANALIAHGIKVSVFEQAPALGEVGAGVYITPNSVRQLQRVGLGPAVEKWGALVGPKSHYFRHDGTPIVSTVVGPWESASESTLWPPDPSRWPCIAAGDERTFSLTVEVYKPEGRPTVSPR